MQGECGAVGFGELPDDGEPSPHPLSPLPGIRWKRSSTLSRIDACIPGPVSRTLSTISSPRPVHAEYASVDYRLGDMTSTTPGLKYGLAMSDGEEFSVRAEYKNQSDDNDRFEDVDAFILQASYSFLF